MNPGYLVRLRYIAIALLLVFQFPTSAYADECVVLLHGLARSPLSMKRVEAKFKDAGFQVVNQGYPSRQSSLQELAPLAIEAALNDCGDYERVSFVTHSMGGILVRTYLHARPLAKMHRVVMLAPPNQGSPLVDVYGKFSFVRDWLGPAFAQLSAHDAYSVPKHIGPADFDLGIIAGNRSVNPILSLLIEGKDDGKVSVKSTQLHGAREHMVLPVSHAFMTYNSDVIDATVRFIRDGSFSSSSG